MCIWAPKRFFPHPSFKAGLDDISCRLSLLPMATHTIAFAAYLDEASSNDLDDLVTFDVKPGFLRVLRKPPVAYRDKAHSAFVFGPLHPLAEYQNVGSVSDDDLGLAVLFDMTELNKYAKREKKSPAALASQTFSLIYDESYDEHYKNIDDSQPVAPLSRKEFPWLVSVVVPTINSTNTITLWVHGTNPAAGGKIDGVILDGGYFFDENNGSVLDQTYVLTRRAHQVAYRTAHELENLVDRYERKGTAAQRLVPHVEAILAELDGASDKIRLLLDSYQQYQSQSASDDEDSDAGESEGESGRRRKVSSQKKAKESACAGTLVELKRYAKSVDVPLYEKGKPLPKARLLDSLKKKGYC